MVLGSPRFDLIKLELRITINGFQNVNSGAADQSWTLQRHYKRGDHRYFNLLLLLHCTCESVRRDRYCEAQFHIDDQHVGLLPIQRGAPSCYRLRDYHCVYLLQRAVFVRGEYYDVRVLCVVLHHLSHNGYFVGFFVDVRSSPSFL